MMAGAGNEFDLLAMHQYQHQQQRDWTHDQAVPTTTCEQFNRSDYFSPSSSSLGVANFTDSSLRAQQWPDSNPGSEYEDFGCSVDDYFGPASAASSREDFALTEESLEAYLPAGFPTTDLNPQRASTEINTAPLSTTDDTTNQDASKIRPIRFVLEPVDPLLDKSRLTPTRSSRSSRSPRASHSDAERRYRNNLNKQLHLLRAKLPNSVAGVAMTKTGTTASCCKTSTKASVVSEAIAYIGELEAQQARLVEEKAVICRQMAELCRSMCCPNCAVLLPSSGPTGTSQIAYN